MDGLSSRCFQKWWVVGGSSGFLHYHDCAHWKEPWNRKNRLTKLRRSSDYCCSATVALDLLAALMRALVDNDNWRVADEEGVGTPPKPQWRGQFRNTCAVALLPISRIVAQTSRMKESTVCDSQ